jgi:hypothetical protein
MVPGDLDVRAGGQAARLTADALTLRTPALVAAEIAGAVPGLEAPRAFAHVAVPHVRLLACSPTRTLGALLGLRHRLAAALVTGDATLSPGVARFLARPLVGRAFLVRSLASLACNLALLCTIHRSESTIFLGHVSLLPSL